MWYIGIILYFLPKIQELKLLYYGYYKFVFKIVIIIAYPL